MVFLLDVHVLTPGPHLELFNLHPPDSWLISLLHSSVLTLLLVPVSGCYLKQILGLASITMSSTPPPHALQEITIDRADGDVDRVGPDPPEVSVQTPLNTCTPRGVRSKTNFGLYILHVCFATIYIFMTSQDTQPGWFKTVRLV